jgi:hypothetical protein
VALLVAGVGFGEVQMLQQLWPHWTWVWK